LGDLSFQSTLCLCGVGGESTVSRRRLAVVAVGKEQPGHCGAYTLYHRPLRTVQADTKIVSDSSSLIPILLVEFLIYFLIL